jgi:hypothetical protein
MQVEVDEGAAAFNASVGFISAMGTPIIIPFGLSPPTVDAKAATVPPKPTGWVVTISATASELVWWWD